MILTISEEYGSGAPEISAALSRSLGLRLYDKEIISQEAKTQGFYDDIKPLLGEAYRDSLLYAIAMNCGRGEPSGAAVRRLRQLAEQEPCILLEMGGNYILRDRQDLISVFLHADKKVRVAKVMEKEGVNPYQALRVISREDGGKEKFYQYYLGESWKSAAGYHLALDTGILGYNKTVRLLSMCAAPRNGPFAAD